MIQLIADKFSGMQGKTYGLRCSPPATKLAVFFTSLIFNEQG